MKKVFAFYPTVAASQSANGISGNVFFPTTSATSSYSPVIKLDHHFTDRESLSLRYGYNHSFDPDPFHSDILPGGIGAIASKDIDEGLAAQLTSTLSQQSGQQSSIWMEPHLCHLLLGAEYSERAG